MSSFIEEIKEIIAEKHLLNHPFYQAWSKGKLPLGVMHEYAKQYYHLEKAFPIFLSTMHSRAGDDFAARQLILENLSDEERGLKNHRQLWLDYSEGIGVSRREVEESIPLKETQDAVDTFRHYAENSMIEGVAALSAYESQIPPVAMSKIQGLTSHYGIDDPTTLAFFRIHGELDIEHADAWWTIMEQYGESDAARQKMKEAVVAGRDALWNFLTGIVRAHMPELERECAMA